MSGNDAVQQHDWQNDGRHLTVGEAVSAIASYCRAMREHDREPLFSDLPRVLGLRAAVLRTPTKAPDHG